MAYHIIKQPDGAYALWSSVVDAFVVLDATPEELIQYFLAQEEQRIRESVERIIQQLDRQERPYYQFTMSWQEALEWYHTVHGEAFDLDAARRGTGSNRGDGCEYVHESGDDMSDPYRHRCHVADGLYVEGHAVVFFDVKAQLWVLALPDLVIWAQWHADRTQLYPLGSRDDNTYAASTYIDWCPWCGSHLPDAPDALAAGQVGAQQGVEDLAPGGGAVEQSQRRAGPRRGGRR